MSNRDRIGKAFELLATGLDEFITRALSVDVPAGKDWTLLLAAKDARGGAQRTYDRRDPQCSLRMLTENITGSAPQGWYPFDALLSRSEKSLASELRDARNDWAHNNAFSADDAYRTLDTAERCCALPVSPVRPRR